MVEEGNLFSRFVVNGVLKFGVRLGRTWVTADHLSCTFCFVFNKKILFTLKKNVKQNYFNADIGLC
uniref:Uncharacterized protein n=1 Tax=Nelumbo nucifera TaxID=4432 RepID=A0A822ZDR3_NELNU|nr:TPA_asm: hypothetical protein HUJ06_001492 [Nelumbo nucifera]